MIVYQIPPRSPLKKIGMSFTGTFNAPTLGVYDFAGSTPATAFTIRPNTVYLIERISTATTISEADFLANVNTPLTLTFRKRSTNEIIFSQPMPMLLFYSNAEFSGWIQNALGDDEIYCTLDGVLNQGPALVGIPSIDFLVSLDVYTINHTEYQRMFRDGVTGERANWNA